MEDSIIKLTSRHIAKLLDNLHRLSDMEKQAIKRQMRYLQDDIISKLKQGKQDEETTTTRQ